MGKEEIRENEFVGNSLVVEYEIEKKKVSGVCFHFTEGGILLEDEMANALIKIS